MRFTDNLMLIDSSKTLKVIMIVVVTTFCQACAVTINPHNFTINNQASPHLSQLTQGSITIKSQPIETSGRAIPVAGFNITVNENEFTKVLVGKLKSTLNISDTVTTGESKILTIQVSRVSIQPDIMMNCVIDYNRKLGNGVFFGFQTRSRNWNYETACENALTQAANEILNNRDTVKYFEGE